MSRIAISRLLIRLQQTSMTNDIPRNGRPRVTSQRQDRHIRLNHLWNFIITGADTTSKRPSLANVRISGQTVRGRLRESENRERHQVIWTILKQRHRTARLAWARARRRWRALHLATHLFLIMNPDYHCLRLRNGRYRVHRRHGERFTDQCVYVSDHFRGGSIMVWAVLESVIMGTQYSFRCCKR